jgi:hypothetical protein
MGKSLKKGQFFIASVIVVSVVLLISMSYASTANLLSIELQDYNVKVQFETIKLAYDSAVPKDWDNGELLNRKKLLLCGNVGTPTIFNTSIAFTSGGGDCTRDVYSPNTTLYVSAATSTCEVFVNLSIIDTTQGYNCTTITVYYNSSTANLGTSLIGSNGFDNVTSVGEYHVESIASSPEGQLMKRYLDALASLNETAHSNENYNVSYRSSNINYDGSI